MASEAINLVAIIYPKPDKAAELSALMAEVTQKVQANEPDTLLYYAFTNEQNKDEIIVVERYRNAAALDAHVKGPHFQEFVKKASALMAKPFELKKGGFLPASAGVARL
ncbi:putative quinol monooxygenase [Aspergillus chevalieri]|uniref:ABM domain-containing protein n=1 Tax=Aspergillus chevalieri TaxID=182096 RepID=A0A7R7ZSA7_ASPCH|nr:uncharacterized protein ACHE_70454A [Aspergillus chevalieri]BCR91611.1 hypothetical protein ACHE_70454A [Aspergillus chevalieri]